MSRQKPDQDMIGPLRHNSLPGANGGKIGYLFNAVSFCSPGDEAAFLRNALAFMFSFVVALVIGVVLQ